MTIRIDNHTVTKITVKRRGNKSDLILMELGNSPRPFLRTAKERLPVLCVEVESGYAEEWLTYMFGAFYIIHAEEEKESPVVKCDEPQVSRHPTGSFSREKYETVSIDSWRRYVPDKYRYCPSCSSEMTLVSDALGENKTLVCSCGYKHVLDGGER